jgi:hypothetical protein
MLQSHWITHREVDKKKTAAAIKVCVLLALYAITTFASRPRASQRSERSQGCKECTRYLFTQDQDRLLARCWRQVLLARTVWDILLMLANMTDKPRPRSRHEQVIKTAANFIEDVRRSGRNLNAANALQTFAYTQKGPLNELTNIFRHQY